MEGGDDNAGSEHEYEDVGDGDGADGATVKKEDSSLMMMMMMMVKAV